MPPTPRKTPKIILAQDELSEYYGPHREHLGMVPPHRGQIVSKARLAQLQEAKQAAAPQLMPGGRATLRSIPTMAEFTDAPRLSVKKNQMHVAFKGGEAMPLPKAIDQVTKLLARLQKSGQSDELQRATKVLAHLQGLTKVEAMLKQLPPTEGVMASPARAAALQRQKRVFDPSRSKIFDPNKKAAPSHFAKKTYAERQSEATPEDARAARLATYLELQEPGPTKLPQNIQEALREKFGRPGRVVPSEFTERGLPVPKKLAALVTGPQIVKSGLFTTKSLPSPKRKSAGLQQYLEDLAGSGYSGPTPSRIENISPQEVTSVLQRGRRMIESLQVTPVKKAAKTFKALKAEMENAVKSGSVSREVADSTMNRIVEGIMTSGYADALLGKISGGKWRKNPIARMIRLAEKSRRA